MYPSDYVEEVLSSPEFKTWISDEQIDTDLDNWSSYVFAALASLTIGSAVTLLFFRDLSVFWAGLFGSSTACFVIYWMLMGFGRGRVFIANNEEFDIRTHYASLFRDRWDAILEVRQVGRLGFEIVTAKGSATLWWSPYHILNSGYSSFTYHLFRAMALGMRSSRFKAFRIPAVLEEGKSFHYSISGKSKQHFLFGCTVTFVGLIQLGIKFTLPSHKPLEWVTSIVYLLPGTLWLLLELLDTRAKDVKSLTVKGTNLVIQTNKSERSVPFKKIDGKITPSISPIAFGESETYGDSNDSIQIDRRFLVEMS